MAAGVSVQFGTIVVPPWIVDHPSFLRWLRSGDVPDEARVCYINGIVWVDPMSERAFSHNKVKTDVARVVSGLVEAEGLGVYFGDGMTYTNGPEQFTSVPDGMFVSHAGMDGRRVWLTGGEHGHQDTELVGVPDLVIEVVSPTSVDKDTAWLPAKYWAAGVPEYWLIDAREGSPKFTIFRHRADGYAAVRKAGGWLKSPVLGRSFRFTPGDALMGRPTYRFEVR